MRFAGLLLNLAFLSLLLLLVYRISRSSVAETSGGRESAPSTEARLRAEGADGTFPLRARTLVGRDDHCDVVIRDDFTSGEHAMISWENGRWIVKDLGSTNGTFVNGARIEGAALRPGDRISIGSSVLILEESGRS